jgi:hypothetical protein
MLPKQLDRSATWRCGLARDSNKKLTIGIFLRDDIYGGLRFEDKNKVTENFSAPVYWDHGANNRTLKSLMERRFKAVTQSDAHVKWDQIFDEDHHDVLERLRIVGDRAADGKASP